MKLLVDMNLSPRWAGLLASEGLEAVHGSQVGAFDAPDREIMAYAAHWGYTVLTHDLDFRPFWLPLKGKRPASYKCAPAI